MSYLYNPVKKTVKYKDQTVSFYCGPELNDIGTILLDFNFNITGLQETLVRLLIVTSQTVDKNRPPSFKDFQKKLLKEIATNFEIPESLLYSEPEPERGVIHPPELRHSIDSLLCKVNKVTSSHRHGLSVPKSDLTALSNQQLETEEVFRKSD